MVKYRFCFVKEGDAVFISHLDLVRLFTRVFRRARLPLAYSEGFNPHPRMRFGLPLSVGVASTCEYLEADFTAPLDPDTAIAAMNATLPSGMRVTNCMEAGDCSAQLSDIMAADFTVTLPGGIPSEAQLAAFLARADIVVDKRTKRGTKPTDIRPDILAITPLADGSGLAMRLHAGSQANLKPQTVLAAMALYMDGFSAPDAAVCRTALHTTSGLPLI